MTMLFSALLISLKALFGGDVSNVDIQALAQLQNHGVIVIDTLEVN